MKDRNKNNGKLNEMKRQNLKFSQRPMIDYL